MFGRLTLKIILFLNHYDYSYLNNFTQVFTYLPLFEPNFFHDASFLKELEKKCVPNIDQHY